MIETTVMKELSQLNISSFAIMDVKIYGAQLFQYQDWL